MNFLLNALKSWKSTAAGFITLFGVGVAAYQNPAILANPATLATIATGAGLIAAKDGDQTGVATPPSPPPPVARRPRKVIQIRADPKPPDHPLLANA